MNQSASTLWQKSARGWDPFKYDTSAIGSVVVYWHVIARPGDNSFYPDYVKEMLDGKSAVR